MAEEKKTSTKADAKSEKTARAEFILIQIKPQPSEICLKKNVSGLECKSSPTARLKALTGI